MEAEIERKERLVAGLEARLAADWADVDAVTAHRHAREELAALLTEWEVLLDQATS